MDDLLEAAIMADWLQAAIMADWLAAAIMFWTVLVTYAGATRPNCTCQA
jgi:hypothetical protein